MPPKKKRSKTKMTRHHRKPRFLGGTGRKDNIERIEEHLHRAYHTLFAWGTAHLVAAVVNARFLPLDEVIVPIPTKHLETVLSFLEATCNVHVDPESIGITEKHCRHARST